MHVYQHLYPPCVCKAFQLLLYRHNSNCKRAYSRDFIKVVRELKQRDISVNIIFFDMPYRTKMFLFDHTIDIRDEPAPSPTRA